MAAAIPVVVLYDVDKLNFGSSTRFHRGEGCVAYVKYTTNVRREGHKIGSVIEAEVMNAYHSVKTESTPSACLR